MDYLLIALAKLWPFLAGLLALAFAFFRVRSSAYTRGRRDASLEHLDSTLKERSHNDYLIDAARRARARAESSDYDELHDPHRRD